MRSVADRGRIVETESIRFRVTASVATWSDVLIPDRRMQAVASRM